MLWLLAALQVALLLPLQSHGLLYEEDPEQAKQVNIGENTAFNTSTRFRYVGRYFTGLTLIPKWGCVSIGGTIFRQNVISSQNVQQFEFICPLLAEHANETIDEDQYTFTYQSFDNTSAVAKAIQDDLQKAADGFLEYTPVVVSGILITWKNARNKNTENLDTNTYQLALVIGEETKPPLPQRSPTFVVFNYDKVAWSGWTSLPEDAQDTLVSVAGMMHGDYKGSTRLPFTKSGFDQLTSKSTLPGTSGRYVYEVSEQPQRLGCLDMPKVNSSDDAEPLTISANAADIFGGLLLKVQGQCRSSDAGFNAQCGFVDTDMDNKPFWRKVNAEYINDYTAICITPRTELGSTEIGMSLNDFNANETVPFKSSFYVSAPTAETALVQITDDSDFLVARPKGSITITWQPEMFLAIPDAQLDVYIFGFRVVNEIYESHEFKIGSVAAIDGTYTINPRETQCDLSANDCRGYLIGQFMLQLPNITLPASIPKISRVAITSMPIPIGWFVDKFQTSILGSNWYWQFCSAKKAYITSDAYCPCSENLAINDVRSFTRTPDCDRLGSTVCMLQGDAVSTCYSSTPATDYGLRCCYDKNSNLIYSSDSPLTGSYVLEYAPFTNFNQFNVKGARTYLSYYLTHVKNYFACCSGPGLDAPLSGVCSSFAALNEAPARCVDYKASLVSGIAGDPHFLLPDGSTYTFNGLGEYWYAYSTDNQLVKVQIRLGRAVSRYGKQEDRYLVNAALLKAIALKVDDTIIQIQLQPSSYLEDPSLLTKRLMILINGREESWTNEQQVRFYKRFRIASSGDDQNLFHITLSDNGAMVACDYVDDSEGSSGEDGDGPKYVTAGSMNCRISYAPSQESELNGLIGRSSSDGGKTTWQLIKRDDLTADTPAVANLQNQSEVYTFANTWLVQKEETYFTYIGSSYDIINGDRLDGYNPVFDWEPEYITGGDESLLEGDEGIVNSTFYKQCSYDYRLTGSIRLAKKTLVDLEETRSIDVALNAVQRYCPALAMPNTVRTLSAGNSENSTAEITKCVPNYEARDGITFPLTLTCTCTDKEDGTFACEWLPNVPSFDTPCVRSKLYDTTGAKPYDNVFSNVTATSLGITDFSAVYLHRRVNDFFIPIRMGCIGLLVKSAEIKDEPMICPFIADHATTKVGENDPAQFLYQTFDREDSTGTLLEIMSDIKTVGRSFNRELDETVLEKAYVFTWKDVTYNNATCGGDAAACDAVLRNTYQAVIAVVGDKTFVIFNYPKLQWSGRSTPGATPVETSFAGFYYGDRKGNMQLPQSNTPSITKLAVMSTFPDIPGRHIFEVSSGDEPRRLGCYSQDTDLGATQPLTTSTSVIDPYGGHVVTVQGACAGAVENVRCGFQRRTSNGSEWLTAPATVKDFYTFVCQSPRLPEVDVGWSEIGLSIDEGKNFVYHSKIYFGSSTNAGPLYPLTVQSDSQFWLSTKPTDEVTVSWNSFFAFGITENPPVELVIIGYDDTASYEFNTSITARATDGQIKFKPSEVVCNQAECEGKLIGQLAVRIRTADLEGLFMSSRIQRSMILSSMMPIGWFVNTYHQTKGGETWYYGFCNATTGQSDFQRSVPLCPSTRAMADVDDMRVFFTAPDCIASTGGNNNPCMFSPGAEVCYTTLPYSGSNGLRCCYDKNGKYLKAEGNALAGSYVLPDAVDSNFENFDLLGKSAQLSFQLSHVRQFFACCAADGGKVPISEQCASFVSQRAAAGDGTESKISQWTAVVGDPHFVTADGLKYTFNGVGEFWFLYSLDPKFQTGIQVRFTKFYNTRLGKDLATVMSGIALSFKNSKVEVHLQPQSFRQGSGRYLAVLVDGTERYFDAASTQIISGFKINVNYEQKIVSIKTKDDGSMIHCYYVALEGQFDGAMSCGIALSNNYKTSSSIYGLVGTWDDNTANDLTPRGTLYSASAESAKATTENLTDIHNFGLSWRVANKSESLFTYAKDQWEVINQETLTFLPELSIPPAITTSFNETDVKAVCGTGVNAIRCEYDLKITDSVRFARATLQALDDIDSRRGQSVDPGPDPDAPKCSPLDVPYTDFTYSADMAVGSTASATGCRAGYVASSGISFPVIYTCTQSADKIVSWSPAPTLLCRSEKPTIGDFDVEDEIDPFGATSRSAGTPRAGNSVNFETPVRFGGQAVSGFTVNPSSGCIIMRPDMANDYLNNEAGVPLSGSKDLPLICPLFSSNARARAGPGVTDTYKIYNKKINESDEELLELQYELITATQYFGQAFSGLKVTTAYIVYWQNARELGSNCSTQEACDGLPRNSYQAIIVITNSAPFVFFNYENIGWSGITTAAKTNSFVGLNYGYNKGSVGLPYSGMDTTNLQELLKLGTVFGFNGRYVYHVFDQFDRIGCMNLPAAYTRNETLTLSTNVADVYGGRRVMMQSFCKSDAVICAFKREGTSEWERNDYVRWMDDYTAVCKLTRRPYVDVGEWTLGVSNDGGATWRYQQKMYLSGTVEDRVPVRLTDSLLWYSVKPSSALNVVWEPAFFSSFSGNVSIKLLTYADPAGKDYNKGVREYALGKALASAGQFSINASEVKCAASTCGDDLIGQVAVIVDDADPWLISSLDYAAITSALVPIGWFVNDIKVESTGKTNWYFDYCDTTEVTNNQQCPCSAAIARADERLFTRAPSCDNLFGSDCLIAPRSDECFTTLPLDESGVGLLCCYDAVGDLLYGQDQPYGGSYVLPYAPMASESVFGIKNAIGYLSYHYSHVKNQFACCSANVPNVVTGKCFEFVEKRSIPKGCVDYEASGLSTVAGDPHIITADSTIYTFNGVGEYWWLFDNNSTNDITDLPQIQVRFENGFTPSGSTTKKEYTASFLTALVIDDSQNKIQIQLQDPSSLANGGKKLALYINGEEKQFYTYPTVEYIGKFRVSSTAQHDLFEITSPFNRYSVKCNYVDIDQTLRLGAMSCNVFLPKRFQSALSGLIGSWDNNQFNDLVARSGGEPVGAYDLTAVNNYGKTWRVLETETLFKYVGTTYAQVNSAIDTFEPSLTMQPDNAALTQDNINVVCSTSGTFRDRCEYDYRVTSSGDLARNTGAWLSAASAVQNTFTTVSTEYCPFVDVPYSMKSYTLGRRINSLATIYGCYKGYAAASNIEFPLAYSCRRTTSGTIDWQPSLPQNLCVAVPIDTTTTTTAPTFTNTTTTETITCPTITCPTTVPTVTSCEPIVVTNNVPPAGNWVDIGVVIGVSVVAGVFLISTVGLIVLLLKQKDKMARINSGNSSDSPMANMESGYANAAVTKSTVSLRSQTAAEAVAQRPASSKSNVVASAVVNNDNDYDLDQSSL